MSNNRTRWLDKLRPAATSSGGWTEGPMAPVETTDAATVDQRCSFKHQTGWRHNHSNSKLCVSLRMGQANLLSITNCRLCAGAMLSSSYDSNLRVSSLNRGHTLQMTPIHSHSSRSSSSRHSRKEVCAWIWRTETAMMMMMMMMMMMSGVNGTWLYSGHASNKSTRTSPSGMEAFVVPSASSQERPNDSIS